MNPPPKIEPPKSDQVCPHCGQPVFAGSSHCPRCGYRFVRERTGMPTVVKVILIVVGTIVGLVVLAFGACILMLSQSGH